MRPKLHILLFSILTISSILACTLPGDQVPPQEDIPLDTMVALTVDAANLMATATQVFADASQIPPPTDQDQPPPPTDTAVPPTPTPTATNTPIPTFTPTLSPNDPALNLGSSDWNVKFDSKYDWWTYDDDPDHKAEIKNGKLLFTMIKPLGWSVWVFAAPEVTDYYLEITAKTPSDCPGKERYGLIFQTPKSSYTEGYLLQVACSGEFRLGMYDGSSWDSLIKWTSDPAINAGPDKTNKLGVMKQGKQIAVYINGQLVGKATDDSYTGEGKFGVLVHSDNTNNFTITFDNASYWELP